jgi:uncharacterized protein YggE
MLYDSDLEGDKTLNAIHRFWALGVLLALTARAQVAVSPTASGDRGPQIVVSGTGEVSVPPAKASFSIEIKTTASTAGAASAENARLSRLVTDGLHSANIRASEVTGSQISVGPQWSYDESARRQKRTAYAATNSIQIQTEQLDRVAAYIDAALSAGATGVSEVFYSEKDPAAVRRQALGEAVAAARRDAEAMAHAGGGRLGELELLSTEQSDLMATQMRMFKKSVAESSEIIAPQITVNAKVLARWRFLSGLAEK